MTDHLDKYLPELEDVELHRDQKREILAVLWQFMESQVDMAFGLHPVQACGKGEKVLPGDSRAALDSKGSKAIQHFNRASKET